MSSEVGSIEAAHDGDSSFDPAHRAYAMGSVLLAVAFLESAINELYQDVFEGHSSYTKPLSADCLQAMRDSWEHEGSGGRYTETLEKYQEALAAKGSDQFHRGSTPFQDVASLIALRNALIHFKPETANITDYNALEAKLRERFAPSLLMAGSGNPFFPDHCLGYGCTEWAHSTAEAFVDEFTSRMEVELNYQVAKDWPKP